MPIDWERDERGVLVLPPKPTGRRVLECARCGEPVAGRTARWWGDDDYLELLREYFDLERLLRQAEARLLREQGESAWWQEQAEWRLEHLCAVAKILAES